MHDDVAVPMFLLHPPTQYCILTSVSSPNGNCKCSWLIAAVLRAGRGDPQPEVDDDGSQQQQGQDGRPNTIVEPGLAPDADRFRSPVVRPQRIQEREDGDASEQEGGYLGGFVAEVEHAHGEGADDDGEVEP